MVFDRSEKYFQTKKLWRKTFSSIFSITRFFQCSILMLFIYLGSDAYLMRDRNCTRCIDFRQISTILHYTHWCNGINNIMLMGLHNELTFWDWYDVWATPFRKTLEILDLPTTPEACQMMIKHQMKKRVMENMGEKVFRHNFFVWKYFFNRSKTPFVPYSKVTKKRKNKVRTSKFSKWAQNFVWVVI